MPTEGMTEFGEGVHIFEKIVEARAMTARQYAHQVLGQARFGRCSARNEAVERLLESRASAISPSATGFPAVQTSPICG